MMYLPSYYSCWFYMYLFSSTTDWTQGLVHARQAACLPRVTLPAHIFILKQCLTKLPRQIV